MTITAKQALKAQYSLGECHDEALVAYAISIENPTRSKHSLAQLERHFAKAAHELGYRLVPLLDEADIEEKPFVEQVKADAFTERQIALDGAQS